MIYFDKKTYRVLKAISNKTPGTAFAVLAQRFIGNLVNSDTPERAELVNTIHILCEEGFIVCKTPDKGIVLLDDAALHINKAAVFIRSAKGNEIVEKHVRDEVQIKAALALSGLSLLIDVLQWLF